MGSMNCTTVTLVPKGPNPNHAKEFRPISCCTTMHTLIGKILTTKLKIVVDSLVGPSEFAFIEGRSILDNVIVAHELIKGYGQKHVSPKCCVKIDLRKANDSVEWGFLRMILIEYGLPDKMVQWIMACVYTVSYSLLINGSLADEFKAKKRTRTRGSYVPLYVCPSYGILKYILKAIET
ncbi:uncharacterized protein LOC132053674 [Lycium ferocissimum]|uniref:uncharacterized protein LOC132053674 n=1 Tax=Lycium ferocissimum TaxID=112874 RepID=UPI002815A10F|nr:uncharacterized protein LOC132053674 [Lycium ferocissimum]